MRKLLIVSLVFFFSGVFSQSYAKKNNYVYAVCLLRTDAVANFSNKPLFQCIPPSRWLFTTPMYEDTRAYFSKKFSGISEINKIKGCIREGINSLNEWRLSCEYDESGGFLDISEVAVKNCKYSSLGRREFFVKCRVLKGPTAKARREQKAIDERLYREEKKRNKARREATERRIAKRKADQAKVRELLETRERENREKRKVQNILAIVSLVILVSAAALGLL